LSVVFVWDTRRVLLLADAVAPKGKDDPQAAMWKRTNSGAYAARAVGKDPRVYEARNGLWRVKEWPKVPKSRKWELLRRVGEQWESQSFWPSSDLALKTSSRNPSWSTDGQGYVYDDSRRLGGDRDIYLFRSFQNVPLTIDSATDENPDWSPDMNYVVYESDRSGNWDIWITDTVSAVETATWGNIKSRFMPLPGPSGIRLKE
jgi:hypothetical protein